MSWNPTDITLEEEILKGIWTAFGTIPLEKEEAIHTAAYFATIDIIARYKRNEVNLYLAHIIDPQTENDNARQDTTRRRLACKVLARILENHRHDGDIQQLPFLKDIFERISFDSTLDFNPEIRGESAHLFGLAVAILRNDLKANIHGLTSKLKDYTSFNAKMALISLGQICQKFSSYMVRSFENSQGDDTLTIIIRTAIVFMNSLEIEADFKIVCITLISEFQGVQSKVIISYIGEIVHSLRCLASSEVAELKQHVCFAFRILLADYREFVTPYLDKVVDAILEIDRTSQCFANVEETSSFWKEFAELDSQGLRKVLVPRMSELASAIRSHLIDDVSIHWNYESEISMEDLSDDEYDGVTVRTISIECFTKLASVYMSDLTSVLYPQLEAIFNGDNWQLFESAIQAFVAVVEGHFDEQLYLELPKFIQYLVKAMGSGNHYVRSTACWAVGRLSSKICEWYRRNASVDSESQFLDLINLLFSYFYYNEPWRVSHAACGALLGLAKNSETSDENFNSALPQMVVRLSYSLPRRRDRVLSDSFELISAFLDCRNKFLDPEISGNETAFQNDPSKCAVHLINFFEINLNTISDLNVPLSLSFLRCFKSTQEFCGPNTQGLVNTIFVRGMIIINATLMSNGQQISAYDKDCVNVILNIFSAIIQNDEDYVHTPGFFQVLFYCFDLRLTQFEMIIAAAYDLMIVVLECEHETLNNNRHYILERVMTNIVRSEHLLKKRSIVIINLIESSWPGQNLSVESYLLSIKQGIQSSFIDPMFSDNLVTIIGCVAILAPEKVANNMDLVSCQKWLYGVSRLEDSYERDLLCFGFCKSFLLMLNRFVDYLPVLELMFTTIGQWENPIDELGELFNQIVSGSKELLDDDIYTHLTQLLPSDGEN